LSSVQRSQNSCARHRRASGRRDRTMVGDHDDVWSRLWPTRPCVSTRGHVIPSGPLPRIRPASCARLSVLLRRLFQGELTRTMCTGSSSSAKTNRSPTKRLPISGCSQSGSTSTFSIGPTASLITPSCTRLDNIVCSLSGCPLRTKM